MGTVKELLDIAKSYIGVKESPANSNNVIFNTWYYGREVSGSAYPWCMAYVQFCCNKAGVQLPQRTASCTALMNAARITGEWTIGPYKPGDLVIYDFEGDGKVDHIGIVESVTSTGVVAIEGNTSPDEKGSQDNGGMVCRKTRKLSLIKGAVRPKYEEDDMDISKLTDSEVLQLADRMQTLLGKKNVSAALAQELKEAKAAGITDGSNPYAFCTRAQAAVMTYRAMKRR